MLKMTLILVGLVMALSGCGKAEQEKIAQESQIKMQADKARMDLQEKANALARNPPPELIKAAQEQAAKDAEKAGK